MMKPNSLLLLSLAGAGLLGVTMLQARGGLTPAAAAAPAPAALPHPGIAAEGRVTAYPGAEVDVSAERAGRVLRVLVKEGDSVRAGALLAQLDSDELRASHAQALARIAEAEAEIRLAEASLARQRSLVEQGIATAQALDQARRDIETASARRETASAEADLYAAQLAKTWILAPISGTVTERAVDAGERVEPGTLVFRVADLARLRVEGEADEADAGALAVDAAVTITADGYPDAAWRGHVERVADDVTPRRLKPRDPARPTDTRVIAVEVAFAEATPLKLGTTVDLRITPVTAAHAR